MCRMNYSEMTSINELIAPIQGQQYEYSYWDNKGKYQKTIDYLWIHYVPEQGEASSEVGEAVRAINRLMYDFYNNGFCNAVNEEREDCPSCYGSGYEGDEDDCSYCGGDCDVVTDYNLDSYYDKMARAIGKYLGDSTYYHAFRELAYRVGHYDADFDSEYIKFMDVTADAISEKWLSTRFAYA
mgnify:CR=1 FL=1|jgi:hypothetical protein